MIEPGKIDEFLDQRKAEKRDNPEYLFMTEETWLSMKREGVTTEILEGVPWRYYRAVRVIIVDGDFPCFPQALQAQFTAGWIDKKEFHER